MSGRSSPEEDAPAHPRRTASPAATDASSLATAEPFASTNAATTDASDAEGDTSQTLVPGIAPNGLVPATTAVPVPTSTVGKGRGVLGGLLGGVLGSN
jgi:hypothetical protein